MFSSLKAKLITLLFSAALLPILARLCVALLAPVFRSLELPPADLKDIIAFLGGLAPTMPALDGYAQTEVMEIGTTILLLLEGAIAGFGLRVTPVQLRTLLAEIASQLPES